MPTQQVVNNTSTQTTLATTTGTTTTSPTIQTVNGYSTITTSIPFFSASMVGGIITVKNPQITTTGQTAGKNNLIYPASQINEITNIYSTIANQPRTLSGSYDFSILMVQNSTTARVAQVGGFKNTSDDTLGSFNVLLASKPNDGVQWTTPPTNIDYYDTYIVNSFSATNDFTASFVRPLVVTQTENSASFADIILSNIEPATGDVYKVKTLYKPSGQFGDFIDLGDTILERQDILIDTQSFETGVAVGSYYENFGVFENLAEIQQYWTGSKIGTWQAATNIDITYDVDTLIGGARLKPGDTSFNSFQGAGFSMKPAYNQRVYKDTEYIVTFNVATDPDIANYTHTLQTTWFPNPRLDIYVSGSSIQRSEDAFLNILADGTSLPTQFSNTFTGNFKQIDGVLGTRIGTYITKKQPGLYSSCTFRFKALEDGDINLKFIIRFGAFIISDIHVYANKETGYSPNYVRISKRIPTEHLNTPLTFKFQYFDRFGRQANLESVAYGAVFDGGNTYIDGTNNLITGSVFISNQIGSGLELAGVNSGFMRSVGYEGFISASDPTKGGAPGWMIYSGSVLPQSGDNYGGVGLELIADENNFLKYRTFPQSIFIVKAESFFLGSDDNYISGSNGKLEISSSNFILSRDGDVYMKGDVNAVVGTFQDVDIRGKIATFRVSGSSTASPVSGLSRVMLEAWHSASDGAQPSGWYTLTSNTYISSSQPDIATRLPWYIPRFLWDPATKTESITNNAQSASYNEVTAKLSDIEYTYSHDGTKYGLPSSGSTPYTNGLSIASKRQTWNASTSSWSGIRLENIRITPASSVSSQMVPKPDYVLVTGLSNYVGMQIRIIVKRGTTTISGITYTDEFDVYDYTVRDNEHPTFRIPIGAQSSYRINANGNYVYVNPRVDLEIQWRNNSYIGTIPNPLTDILARAVALHETKILELPRVDNLAVRNLRLGDPYRSSVVFDVIGSDLSSSFGGANSSMIALRNTAFATTQDSGYHDLKVRDLYTQRDVITTGSVRFDPSEDPDLTGTLNVSSTHFFQSSSNTALGNDLYIRQDGNLVKWKWIESLLETGLLYGGVVTFSGDEVYVSSGSGIIVNHNANANTEVSPDITYVKWSNITESIANIATQQVTYLYIDQNGTLQQQATRFTRDQYHDSIPLGAVGHFDYTNVSAFGGSVHTTHDTVGQINSFVNAFGPLRISGYDITGQPGSLRISVSNGEAFIYGGFYAEDPEMPSNLSTLAQTTASMVRVRRDGSGGVIFDTNAGSFYTTFDPANYDDGDGTIAAVSNNNWTIQRIYSDPKTGTLYVYYGQSVYTTLENALQGLGSDSFTEGDTFDFTVFIGYAILKSNGTDITNTTDNQILKSGLFRGIPAGSGGGGGGGASTLNGLSDVSLNSPSNGDLFMYDSPNWINTKQLSGSYGITGSLTVKGHLLPGGPYTANTSSYDLGSATAAWRDIYVSNGTVNFISGSQKATISFTNGVIDFGTSSIASPNVITTASVSSNTITFTKGDGSTFPITVDTGSGGGGGGGLTFQQVQMIAFLGS